MEQRVELPEANWHKPDPPEYRCEIRLCPEPEGGYSAYVPELPGAIEQGETIAEATYNIAEALEAVLRTYLQDARPIPWLKNAKPAQEHELCYWIVARV